MDTYPIGELISLNGKSITRINQVSFICSLDSNEKGAFHNESIQFFNFSRVLSYLLAALRLDQPIKGITKSLDEEFPLLVGVPLLNQSSYKEFIHAI